MTLEEAKKISNIIAFADSGCPVCVADMVESFNERFPDFIWTFNQDLPTELRVNVRLVKS